MKYKTRIRVAISSITLSVLAAGCAGTGDFEKQEDGSYKVFCPGGYHDWQGCYTDAKKACGGRDFSVKSRVSDEGSSSTGVKDFSHKGSQVTRSMTVVCQ